MQTKWLAVHRVALVESTELFPHSTPTRVLPQRGALRRILEGSLAGEESSELVRRAAVVEVDPGLQKCRVMLPENTLREHIIHMHWRSARLSPC